MIGVSPNGVKIMVATQPVDFRRGMNGLVALVASALAADPYLCVERDYVAEAVSAPAGACRVWNSAPHNIQMLVSSCRTASFGRKRRPRSPETPAFSSPLRIISTSAAA